MPTCYTLPTCDQRYLPATSGKLLPAVPTCSSYQRLAIANRDSDGSQWKLRRMVERVMEFVDARTTKPCPKTTVSAVVPASRGVALPATVGEALLPAATPDIWLFHVLIGDGIQTNEAAAKQLWACVHEREG